MSAQAGAGVRRRWALAGLASIYLVFCVVLAAVTPRGGGFYDEKFNFAIVGALVSGSASAPPNHWYSPLSWAPQWVVLEVLDWVSQRADVESIAVFRPGTRRLSRSSIVACRIVNVVYGLIALLLVHRIAARVMSPQAALMAVVVFVGSPWAIRGAVEFKPDPLLLMTTLLCVDGSLALIDSYKWRQFARVGVASGLTVSAKLNGILVGPTVALATLMGGVSWRRLSRAVAALALAALTFAATQPWLVDAVGYWRRIQNHYAGKSGKLSFVQMTLRPWQELLSVEFLGPLFGGMAIASLVILLLRTVRAWTSGGEWRRWSILLSYPIFYVLGTAAATRYAKGNAWIQLVPFAAIAAGWGLTAGVDLVASSTARLARSENRHRSLELTIQRLMVTAIAAFALMRSASYVHASVGSPTGYQLNRVTRRTLGPLQIVAAVDPTRSALPKLGGRWSSGPRAAIQRFDTLRVAPDGRLRDFELYDGELYAPERLDENDRSDLARHLDTLPPASVRRVDPTWLLLRGEPWILVSQPWRMHGPAHCRPLIGPRAEIDHPEPGADGVVATLYVKVTFDARPTILRITFAGRTLALLDAGDELEGETPMQLLTTARFRWSAEPLSVEATEDLTGDETVCVQLWDPPVGRTR